MEYVNARNSAVLTRIRNDPNIDKRIATAVLGIEADGDANTIYPRVMPEQLAAAAKVLTEDSSHEPTELMIPDWLDRCSKPVRRTILFLAGAFLVLISFMWFGPAKDKSRQQ